MTVPTFRRCRLIKSINHLIKRELKIDPRFAVIKEVSADELVNDLHSALVRLFAEEKEEGIGADITVTRRLSLQIGGQLGDWDLWGFPKSTNVYIVNSHDPTEIYKAD
jgi:hypothetical protein